MKAGEFHPTIAKLLEAKLKEFGPQDDSSGRDLDLTTCVDIYVTIFNTLVEVLTSAEVHVTNEAMNYLAQTYYDAVKINGRYELDPDIFTQRAKLEEIDTKELKLLAVMLSGTDFSLPILEAVKKRS